MTPLRDGTLLAGYVVGSGKDTDDQAIELRRSMDGGHTWSEPERPFSMVVAGASHPAMLPDGRIVLAWVDRFGTGSIKARLAAGPEAPFTAASEVVIHQDRPPRRPGERSTADDLVEMGSWTYGLPYAEALPDGEVLVVYYAGDAGAVDIRWARLRP